MANAGAMARLMALSSIVALVLCGAWTSFALARAAPVRVLVAATVSDTAKATMSPEVWKHLIGDYVNAEVAPFAGGAPTIDDCRRAKAAFMVAATFDTMPQLPGIALPKDRLSARSHIVGTNCITGNVTFDHVIQLVSNPIAIANQGDLEPVAEIRWQKSVHDTLARNPITLARIARIVKVDGPFCFIEFPPGSNVVPGNTFRIFADKDSVKRPPIMLTITDMTGKFAQCLYDAANGSVPAVGDLVEPVDAK